MSIKEILIYDFRRLQAASLRLSDDEVKSFHDGSKEPNEGVRRLLGSVLGREISRVSSSDGNDVQLLKHPKKNIKIWECTFISERFNRNILIMK